MSQKVLEVKDLRTYFYTRAGVVKAVDGVSFYVAKGETLGLVGESGSGKSMTCLSILRLVPKPAGRIVGGQVLLGGDNLLTKSDAEMRKIRGAKISMVLQDSLAALNPVFTIGDQLTESIKIHQKLRGAPLWDKAKEMLSRVRIDSPDARLRSHPHELSGGMRQRVAGAIAISCQPEVLIADEPTTSLDVTIQAQYLNLLKDVQEQTGVAIIFVTHDFSIVARMCDRVAVMYLGKVVEAAAVRDLFNSPKHPYTVALMKSVPKVEARVTKLYSIEGEPPSLYNLPSGCGFSPRCPARGAECERQLPPLVETEKGHWSRCWIHAPGGATE